MTEASALVSDVARSIADADPLPEAEFVTGQLLTLSTHDERTGKWAVIPGDAQVGPASPASA
jgi:hypothetical protein